ncbi:DNA helicase PIF1, ATP-dependent [Tanacetum coccineum]
MTNASLVSKSATKVVEKSEPSQQAPLFLDQLEVDVTGTIVVMIGRIWDVNTITGRYLSTDFVVSDYKGNMIHCSAKSNVAHNFLRMKEGGIYAVKKIVVVPNKDEYRRSKQDMFMLEFDGETTVRKVSADPHGYSLRVTLWGGLGDVLVEQKTKHVGMCAVVLTGMSVKDYNNKLYLSSSSSTVICDDDDIPCIQELKADCSSASVQPTKAVLAVDSSLPMEGTLENLLIWARNCQNNMRILLPVMTENFRNKKGWNYPSRGYEKCRKCVTRQHGKWFCEACNRPIDYPVFRHMLEVVVADDTASTVVVMFNDTTMELIKCSAELELEDSDGDEVCPTLDNKKKKRYNVSGHGRHTSNKFPQLTCTTKQPHDAHMKFTLQDLFKEISLRLSANPTAGLHFKVLSIVNCTLNSIVRIDSNTITRQDGRVQSYCGLRLTESPLGLSGSDQLVLPDTTTINIAQIAGPSTSKYASTRRPRRPATIPVNYHNIGPHLHQCRNCDATMWYKEREVKAKSAVNPTFSLCCQGVEEQRLNWTRNNQDTLRVELYHNLCDAVTYGDTSAVGLGKRIVLPRTFTGSPIYMMQNYQDAMALCRTYGNPDLFITFTSNPKWPEISEMLTYFPGQKSHDRLEIGTRTPSDIDDIISAELPSPTDYPDAYKIVTDYMLHGPCGKDARNAACTTNGKCSKHFPKKILAETFLDEEGYPHYQRRDNKVTFKKGKFAYDNKHVAPHNRYLLLKYKAHINVEWCNRSKAIKYLFKYLNKGPDRATVVIEENVTKGTAMAPEKVLELSFHLPNQNAITLRDLEKLPALLEKEGIDVIMFIDWFELNKRDPAARAHTYAEIPKHYVWHDKDKL